MNIHTIIDNKNFHLQVILKFKITRIRTVLSLDNLLPLNINREYYEKSLSFINTFLICYLSNFY